jgi:hypothetical protein
MRQRLGLVVGAVVTVVAVVVAATVLVLRPAGADADLDPYRGLGTWVDVFDYAPRLSSTPRVTPASIDDMGGLGPRTLYLQVANPDGAPSDRLSDERVLRALVKRAHRNDLMVVAWFLPDTVDLDADEQFVRLLSEFSVDGRGFDGITLDLESRAIEDVADRNGRVVEITRRARDVIDDDIALGAAVLTAVHLEIINPAYWPDFPYEQLGEHVDVWLPMAYHSDREEESGYRDAYAYGHESVVRLRDNLDDEDAEVHLIGGIADQVAPTDIERLLEAVDRTGAVGWSLYDFATTSSAAWPYLRAGDRVVAG